MGFLHSSRIYLDHNATSPVHPSVRAAMTRALDCIGNPSSVHAEGRAARALIEQARRDVAALVDCAAEDVVFTSGGTEALNMILGPDVFSAEGSVEILLIAAGEHAAVFEGHRFPAAQTGIVAPDAGGRLDLAALAEALDRHAGRRIMLAVQAANNETGVIQPVAEAAALVHARGGIVVCDAVQAAGKIDCRASGFAADALAISAHKFGGPKGVGALIFPSRKYHLRHGVVRGGGQERGLRSGTENLPGIAGLGAAAKFAAGHWRGAADQLTAWRDAIEKIILARVPDAVIFGREAGRLPNTVYFAVPGVEAQILLMNLDLGGVALSSGSACSSGKVKPSHVLQAMGVAPEIAKSALRVSLGWTTRDEDIAGFETAFTKALQTMRRKVPRVAA
jgi:cysteine desulfurase